MLVYTSVWQLLDTPFDQMRLVRVRCPVAIGHLGLFLSCHALVLCPVHASWRETVWWTTSNFLILFSNSGKDSWDCEIGNYYVALSLQQYRLHNCQSLHHPKKFDLVHQTVFPRERVGSRDETTMPSCLPIDRSQAHLQDFQVMGKGKNLGWS